MHKNQYSNKALKWTQLLSFIVMIFCIYNIILDSSKVSDVKNQNSLLSKQLENIKNNNQKLNEENSKLQASIKESQSLYTEKMKNLKVAYLTFDDGPSNNTLNILKILKENNVKATFFVNSKKELSNLYKAIAKDGHALANHTYSHDYRTIYSSPSNFAKDTKKLDSFLTNLTGKQPTKVFRFPGGSNNTISRRYGGRNIMKDTIKYMSKAGYTYFDWNIDSTDASTYRQDKDKIVNSVLNNTPNVKNAVILMHDLNPKTTTVEALPEVIHGLKQQGFQFAVLSTDSTPVQFVKANSLK